MMQWFVSVIQRTTPSLEEKSGAPDIVGMPLRSCPGGNVEKTYTYISACKKLFRTQGSGTQ